MPNSVKIEKLVYGGDGLGRLSDGRAVFVPFVLPDEEISLEITQEKARFTRGTALSWHKSSPPIVFPRDVNISRFVAVATINTCPTKSSLKPNSKPFATNSVASLASIPPRHSATSPKAAKAGTIATKFNAMSPPDGELGFMRANNTGILPPIKQCEIAMPGLNALLETINLDPPESGIKRVIFREDNDGEYFVLLEGEDPPCPPELTVELEVSAGYMDAEQNYHHLAGTDQLHYRILDKDFTLSPGSFFQINNAVCEELVKHVIGLAKSIAPPHKVLELYSGGAGLFSAFWHPR